MRLSILFLVLLFAVGCNSKEAQKGKEEGELKAKQEAKVAAIVSKYGANVTSFRSLDQRADSLRKITTLYLQQTFPNTSIHPFLFYANLEDAFEQDGQYFATFVVTSSSLEGLMYLSDIDILLELKCTQKQVEELLSQDSMPNEFTYLYGIFAIIVKVNDVRKIKLGFKATAVSSEGDNSEEVYSGDAYIDLKRPNISLITGELLDFCVFRY
jgi:hypothetical protein